MVHNYQDVNDKPKETHHIATKYGEWGRKFKAFFDKYGISMDDRSNKVNLHHRGRHAKEYHELIYLFLQEFDSIADSDAEVFKGLLKFLGDWLKDHNDLLYPGGWGR